jgi:hypothetical protein
MADAASVPVAVVSSRTEAALIVGLLNSHGVDAAVVADDVGGQEPQLQLEGVHVLVAAGDADVARRLLDEQGADDASDPGPGTRPGTVPGASE